MLSDNSRKNALEFLASTATGIFITMTPLLDECIGLILLLKYIAIVDITWKRKPFSAHWVCSKRASSASGFRRVRVSVFFP